MSTELYAKGMLRLDGARLYIDLPKGPVDLVVWGPYEHLEPGTYLVKFRIYPTEAERTDALCCHVDVVTDYGNSTIIRKGVRSDELIENNYEIEIKFVVKATNRFEYRVWSAPSSSVTVDYYRKAMRIIEDNSQNGEFFELLRLLTDHAAPSRVIVDAGAYGRDGSNSYDLLRLFGWRGLLIEANPALLDKIRVDFEGLNYTLISCAISDFEGIGDLTLGIADGISSLTPELTAGWGPISGTVSAQVRRLHKVLDENAIPLDFDILSIDLEGHEVRVVNDLHAHSAYRPQWIILEGSHDLRVTDLRQIEISEAVMSDYDLVAKNRVNLFLKRK